VADRVVLIAEVLHCGASGQSRLKRVEPAIIRPIRVPRSDAIAGLDERALAESVVLQATDVGIAVRSLDAACLREQTTRVVPVRQNLTVGVRQRLETAERVKHILRCVHAGRGASEADNGFYLSGRLAELAVETLLGARLVGHPRDAVRAIVA